MQHNELNKIDLVLELHREPELYIIRNEIYAVVVAPVRFFIAFRNHEGATNETLYG